VKTYKEEDEEYCEKCGGSGHDVAYGIARGIPIEETRCAACRGRGLTRLIAEEEQDCLTCGTTGSVDKVKTRVVETVISRRASSLPPTETDKLPSPDGRGTWVTE
jgi:DnaJ-class molecular chaperone